MDFQRLRKGWRRALVYGVCLIFSFSVWADSQYIRVNTDVLNIRSGPGTSNSKVGKVIQGEVLRELGEERDGWKKVAYGDVEGWVSAGFTEPTDNQFSKVETTGGRLRVRATPGGDIIAFLQNGDEVQVIGGVQDGGWVPVQDLKTGKIGYVSQEYLTDDALTEATYLATCDKCGSGWLSDQMKLIEAHARRLAGDREPADTGEVDFNMVNRMANKAWTNATESRRVADFLGGGRRSGNRSKGMCAAAVQETLMDSGICQSWPGGNALNMHTSGNLKACSHLKLSSYTDPHTAPVGSVIVYSGYAGSRPHHFGHIEVVIPVTAQILDRVRADSKLSGQNLHVGDRLYCSDFCRAAPTMTPNNPVAAIYTLR